MAAGGGIVSLLEYRYFGKLELFLGSVFMAVGLFLIAIMGKNRKVPELPAASVRNMHFLFICSISVWLIS